MIKNINLNDSNNLIGSIKSMKEDNSTIIFNNEIVIEFKYLNSYNIITPDENYENNNLEEFIEEVEKIILEYKNSL